MPTFTVRRVLALLLISSMIALSAPAATVRAQTSSCEVSTETPETYGPTDITAVSGNQKMSVGVNADATVTVLKWPSPSYYDQVKYRTTDRSEPRFGALPNEGAFLGLGYKKGKKPWRFDWLRDWSSRQRFADDDGDEVVTNFNKRSQGLRVKVRDVVSHDRDVFVRSVTVKKTKRSRVTRARVVAFANFNPVFSKTQNSPTDDWCTEEDNDDGAEYRKGADVVVQAREGTDSSTGQPSGVALVMGFRGSSDGHQIGVDTYETGSGDVSAYDDAANARLSGADAAPGQADAALADDINLRSRRRGRTDVLIAAGTTPGEAITSLRQARLRGISKVSRTKSRWWRAWLRTTKLPKNAPRPVEALAKRALISTRQATDPGGLIVASIATQPPHGLDWIRNGAYINRMLAISRKRAEVELHNKRYAALQATSVRKPRGGETTPPGNWSQNFYTDGVVGGPIPYEIDETGLGIWTLWDHYATTKDRAYLLSVYEAIQRAAHFLSDNPPLGCRDPATGLQCSANEGDNPALTQTLVGAQAVWLGLGAAVRAGRALGTATSNQNAEKWQARRDELKAAIEARFFDEDCSCYTDDHEIGGTLLWPVGLEPYGSRIANSQAEINWGYVRRVLRGRVQMGGHESKALLGNAYAWKKQPAKLKRVKRGLKWVATVATTDETGVLGEAWMRYPRESSPVQTMVGQPHVWSQAIFYLAAVKAYGATSWSP